jgi:hypothetical protein
MKTKAIIKTNENKKIESDGFNIFDILEKNNVNSISDIKRIILKDVPQGEVLTLLVQIENYNKHFCDGDVFKIKIENKYDINKFMEEDNG